MKFLSIYTLPQSQLAPPAPEEMAAMERLVADSLASGVLLSTGHFPFPGTGFRIRRDGGVCTVRDLDPDPGAVRCGFAVLNVKNREEAIGVAERFLQHVGQGTCEVIELVVAAARNPVFGDEDATPASAGQAL